MLENRLIASNKDIDVYVSKPFKVCSHVFNHLIENGYTVCNEIESAHYLMIDDNIKDFDINLYRDDIGYALKNDMTICLASKGITSFNNGKKDILKFI